MTIHDTKTTEPANVTTIVAGLKNVHATGRTKPIEWRLAQIAAIERLVTEREDEIAAAIHADLGRNAFDSWFGEIVGLQGEIANTRRHLRKWMRKKRHGVPLIQQPGSAWVQYEPLGTVLIIGPWNYPVLLTLCPLMTALAAGNCAVVKPSELAPATSDLLARLIPEYLDPEAATVVEGDGLVTQELLAQGFDHALFTGGTEIGRKIMAGAAPTLTPVTLELGGKSPVVIADDADLDVAARRIAWVKLLNSGQTCIAPDYVLVERSVSDTFVAKLVKSLRGMNAGQGPARRIVNERQFDRLTRYLDTTQGDIVAGGGTDRETLGIEPTVVVDPDPSEPLMTDEIFGPILPVVTVDSVGDAIGRVNAGDKPLGLYVFSKSKATGQRVVDSCPAGGAVINHVAMHFLIPSLPFGGVGASGMGAYHGEYGFQTFSHRKAVLRKTVKPDPRLMFPPYSELAKKLLRKVL